MRNLKLIAGVFVCTMLLFAVSAPAATITWTATGTGNWNVAANWNSGAGPVPTIADVATTTDTSAHNSDVIQVNDAEACLRFTINRGYLDILSGGSMTVKGNDWTSMVGYSASNSYNGGLRLYNGSSLTVGDAGWNSYSFFDGDSNNGARIYQYGGTATFTNLTTVSTGPGNSSYKGLDIGRRGGNALYQISGGTLSLVNTALYVGNNYVSGSPVYVAGNFEVVGSAPTINIQGLVHVDSLGQIISDIGATGVSTMNITGNVEFLTNGTNTATITVNDTGAAPGTYRLMAWSGTQTGTPTVVLPNGNWTSTIGTGYVDVTLTPEPGTLALIAMGGLALIRRRR